MRVLLLFRGAPGCGKSTFIKEHDLEQYTLSADSIRLQIQSPVLMPNGSMGISQKNDKDVWKILFNLLEKRMGKGEFTVVDATNSKTSEISRYKEFADKYRYRMYIVDMTDIPIDVVKERNANRLPEYKRVPDKAIDKMYARFATQKVPSGVKVIKPEELDTILYKPADFSKYKKIHVIGDIHSSFSALKEYLCKQFSETDPVVYIDDTYIEKGKETGIIGKYEGEPITSTNLSKLMFDDELYVFSGDYLDRGIEPIETLKFLLSIYKLPNVILLEGNHEQLGLRNYAHNIDDYSRNFKETTLPYLNKAVGSGEIKKSELRQLCRRFGQVCYFTYRDKKVLVSHGGLSSMKDNLIYVSTEQIIRGVGEYEDYLECAKAFEESTNENTYQINGHRNITEAPVNATERCFNLEGKVEFGGHLRAVTLNETGFQTHEIKNNVFREKEEKVVDVTLPKEDLTDDDIVKQLRANPFVKEKEMGNISSFNFTRDAFYKKHWDEQTTKARGLFIDTRDNSIVARGYNKFWNVNETNATKIMNLKDAMKFPATAYVKENGFLGLISYNKDTDDLMFATKSVVDYAAQENDLVNVFKDLYMETTTEGQRAALLERVKTNNETIICECVHQQKDPHIVEYDSNVIYLLDIISNDFEGIKVGYEDLQIAAKSLGLICKEKAFTFNNWENFYGWYLEVTDEDYQYNGRHIEGFVIEDSAGFMVKLKLVYYNFWKMMRGITHSVLKKGMIKNTASLYNAEANYFYGWLREHRDEYIHEDENGKIILDDVSIIELRKRFKEDMKKKV